MEVHRSKSRRRPSVLLLDESERVAVLPTNFLQSLELSPRNRAKGTLELYATRLRDFCSFLEEHAVLGQVRVDDAVRSMNLAVVDEFYRQCQAKGLEASTVRGYEVVLKMFSDWLASEEAGRAHVHALYTNLPYRTPAATKRMPRFLTVAEVKTLLEGMHWEAQRLVAHFMFDTGMRVSEIPRVLKSDLPKPENYLATQMYFPLLVRGSKGRSRAHKERYTIISRPMLTRLHRYFKTRTYFTNHDWPDDAKPAMLNTHGEPWNAKAIKAFIADAVARTTLTAASSHRLRHGTAFSILRSEHGKNLLENLLILKQMLGHTQIQTTETYTHIPAPVLQRMKQDGGEGEFKFRFEEAQEILDATYRPERKDPTPRRIGKRHG